MASDGYILGLSALGHDSSAALLDPHGSLTAIEEAKLVRSREASGIPREAIRFCFERAGISWRNVAKIAVASNPRQAWRRTAAFRARQAILAPVASAYYASKAFGDLGRELNNLRILQTLAGEPRDRVVPLDHQLCHAASAFFGSPFDRALILSLDEQGDGQCGIVATGEGTQLRVIETIAFPHSIAWVYSQVAELLGFRPQKDEHKLQWLSVAGVPEFEEVFLEMLRAKPGGAPHLNRKYFTRGYTGRLGFSDTLRKGLNLADGHASSAAHRANIAASAQAAIEKVVVEYLESLQRRYRSEKLCLAGGLFLNSLLVAAVEQNAGFGEVFVQPAAGNEGTALGAAWNVWHETPGRKRVAPINEVYWGPSYSNDEIKQVLDNCKANYHWLNGDGPKVEETLRLLSAGKIVAWCQGRAEFGPRALGNRSLLASPWAPYVKENLNDYVKHRESFRPFALAVPEEDCARYFEATPAAKFMASIGVAKPEVQGALKDFLLPGNRVRLHSVNREANPLLWQLLRRSGEGSPGPMLVNTSFNLFGEPLVVTPRDAVRSYFCSGTDALVAGNFILSKM
ncbi:MAG TPA: carbamoyltransferase C-terminal domain-containing protein [Candidatus Acidoferrales bacterium]|nr:carbamoyltransferase C-terminal domain-containing protein [Candidatus Acidoferrales bacterium]